MTRRRPYHSTAFAILIAVLFLILFVLAQLSQAAPIYADVSLDGGIHLRSAESFETGAFWTPDVVTDETLDNPFDLPDAVFDGKYFRVDAPFPAYECGTFQIDAWAHGGWFGELRGYDSPCRETPPCLIDCAPPPVCETDCTPPPCLEANNCDPGMGETVPEPPGLWLFVLVIAAWVFPYHRMPHRWRDVFAGRWR